MSENCSLKAIEIIGLTKRFGDFVANDHIDLSVCKQEIKCIVGENGAGKSTLMNMLYGLLEPTEGRIVINGEDVKLKSPSDAIRHGIGMIHQHFKLVPSLTVYENILLGTEIKKGILVDRKKEAQIVQDLIEQYNFTLDPHSRVRDISLGERQRVEILKMLYRDVDTLILDEPTAVLTPQEVDDLILQLKNLRDQGKTIIVITHKLREVMALSDSVTVIKQGKVIGHRLTKDTCEEELAQMMVGREVSLERKENRKAFSESTPIYEVSELSTKDTFGRDCIKHISFQVRKGQILGIAGVEGNGQSELVKVLTGMMESTSGRISFMGQDITGFWPKELRKLGVGIIPEDRYAQGLSSELSIADNCIAGYHDDAALSQFGVFKEKEILSRRDKILQEYDVRVGDKNGNISSLSGGNAQKIIVGRELSHNPKLLIACQPTRGVDIGSIEFIHNTIFRFRDEGNAVLLISSELSEIMSLSDQVVIMHKGMITGNIDPNSVDMLRIGLLMAGIREEGA